MEKSNAERIAVLETKQERMEEVQAKILETQKEILSKLTRYQGFVGGVLFVFTCIGTFAAASWEAVKHFKLGGG